MAINLVVHVGGGDSDSGLGLLRGFHKNPLDGVGSSSSFWAFTIAAAVTITRGSNDRSGKTSIANDADAVDPGVTVNIGQVAGLHNKVWFLARKATCAVVKIATAGLPKKSYFPASFADKGPVDTDGAGKTSVVIAAIAEVVDPKAGVAFVTAVVTVYPVIVAAKFSEIQGTELSCSVPGRTEIGMWGWRCSCSDPVWVRSGLSSGSLVDDTVSVLANVAGKSRSAVTINADEGPPRTG